MANPGIDMEDEDLTAQAGAPAAGANAANTKAPATAKIVDDEDAEFGDDQEYRRPGELELLKVTQKNTFARFSILISPVTNKGFVKKGYIHYVQGKGYARCLSKHDPKGNFIGEPAFCCKAGKEGEKRYAALIVRYLSIDEKTGKFLKDRPVEFEIQALTVSRIGFKEISLLPGEDELVTSIDMTATPKDETKGLKFSRIAGKASYNHTPALHAAVMEAAKPFLDGRELSRKIGRTITAAEMRVHLGVATAANDDGPGIDDLD